MVAHAGHVVASQVHQLHGGGALRRADGGIALDEVTGVHQQDVGAAGLVGVLQRGHFGIAADGAMHIIGVQDDDVAVQILCRLFRRIGGDSQGERHDHRQQQGQDFLFHSVTSSESAGDDLPWYGYSIAHLEKMDRGDFADFSKKTTRNIPRFL